MNQMNYGDSLKISGSRLKRGEEKPLSLGEDSSTALGWVLC